jgi:cytidyltransferase-like protein
MDQDSKLITLEKARSLFLQLKDSGKTLIQCHGTFDLVHPGHVVHFQEAKSLGDILVVTITSEKFVNKGPGRPYFNDQMRAKWLTALACVDYVVLIPFADAVKAIECVKPHFYCKGKEYENFDKDVTGKIKDEAAEVERWGGKISYVGSVVFSSSRLLNNHFDSGSPEVKKFCKEVAEICPFPLFSEIISSFESLKVLVIGDIIFDHYCTVEVQGLTAKNKVISTRFISDEFQAGGSLAVLRHINQFTPHVKLISLVGTEPWVDNRLKAFVSPEQDGIIKSKEFTSVVKQRYVEPKSDGKELIKLFAINFIDKDPIKEDLEATILKKISDEIKNFDVVLVMDFGHGLMTDKIRDYVQTNSKFLVVNCQTNSNNYGFNILDRKYSRADALTLDKSEITLVAGKRNFSYENALQELTVRLKCSYGWLTGGSTHTFGIKAGHEIHKCPAIEQRIVDTLGAGDAFCSIVALAAARNVPIKVANFMGQLAGAQAVKIVGNSEAISKTKLLKGAASMLSF